MIDKNTKPGTRVLVTKIFETLDDVLAITRPEYHALATGAFVSGRLNLLKLGAELTVEAVVDHHIPVSGVGVKLRELHGDFSLETFSLVEETKS